MNSLSQYLLVPALFSLFYQGITYPFSNLRPKENWIKLVFQLLGAIGLIMGALCFMGQLKGDFEAFEMISLTFDRTRGAIYFFSNLLFAITAHFSINYIHKDQGFYKFFLNFNIFWIGLFLFVFANETMVLFAGWELIGVSSIFLIAYYHHRSSPVFSALFVVSFYKFADIILITSLLLLKHNDILVNHQNYLPFVYLGIVIAGLIKSGSFPFTPWLPRAMEGPTTSSAMFYGALSINTGVLLIYFNIDKVLAFELSRYGLMIMAIMTILFSGFQARIQTDAKTLLGYSASVQIGFVLLELSLGFHNLALVHLFLSGFYKVYQFIKSPSLLNSFHTMVGENQSPFKRNGIHFEKMFPHELRKSLYFLNMNHFYLHGLYERLGFVASKMSVFAEGLLYPLINKGSNVSYWSLMWVVYYILITFFISEGAIEINKHYFDTIPFFILLVSLSMIFQKNLNAFVALMMIYKILESFIVHGVHSHEPFKVVGLIILMVFVGSLLLYKRMKNINKLTKSVMSVFILFLMLYFTNFPFLLQSLVNEHIIEAFLEQDKLFDLLSYCLANTFFNIGLYHFVFHEIYLKEALYE